MKADAKHAVERYQEDFSAGRFFEAHEDLEPLWWQQRSDPLLQGLILLAAAFVQAQRGKARGALRHFSAVTHYLAPYPAWERGVPVGEITAYAEQAQAALRAHLGEGKSGDHLLEVIGPLTLHLNPTAASVGLAATEPDPQEITAAITTAIADRRAAGEPVGPSSWAPICKDVARRLLGRFPRETIRTAVREALRRP